MENKVNQIQLTKVIDLASIFLVSTSLIGILCIASSVFYPLPVVIASLLVTFISGNLLGLLSPKPLKVPLFVGVLLLIALFFRSNPYTYLIGGQDQGVYTNMAQYFQRTGGLSFTDDVRSLFSSQGAPDLYDSDNHHRTDTWGGKELYEGTHFPGLYLSSHRTSKTVFQFYHVHPIWMAIFSKLFGSSNASWSMVFFGILSILYWSLVAYKLWSNEAKPGLIAASFLAVSPLHAYFSKFPVAEVTASCFLGASLYYLLRLVRDDNRNSATLALGVLSLFCCFLTRISGFIFLPFFALLLGVYLLDIKASRRSRQIGWFAGLSLVLYFISAWYGWRYSFPYAFDIYHWSFQPVFGHAWPLVLKVVLGVFLMLAVGVRFSPPSFKIKVIKLFNLSGNFVTPLLILFCLFSLYKGYKLGFFEGYTGDDWYSSDSVPRGWESLKFTSTYALILHLTPVGLLAIFFGTFALRKSKDPILLYAFLWLCLSWFYGLVLQWFMKYQFYYGRYLVSETLPITIVFLGGILSEGSKSPSFLIKGLSKVSLVAIGSLFIFQAFPQIQISEGEDSKRFFDKLSHAIEPNSLLVLDRSSVSEASNIYIRLPMEITFQTRTLEVSGWDNLHQKLPYLVNYFDNFFVLTESNEEIPSYLTLERILTFGHTTLERTQDIPKGPESDNKKFFLFKLNKGVYGNYANIIYPAFSKSSGIYPSSTWTDGGAKFSKLDISLDSLRIVRINTFGHRIRLAGKLEPKLLINNSVEARFVGIDDINGSLSFEIPNSVTKITDLSIYTSTFIPSELGINGDKRRLGLDIRSIEILR